MSEPKQLVGEFWGGTAAMLVAVPSSIAFGVTIFAPLGSIYAAYGAIAGILGTVALGLTAPAIGGTNRLITAPCAPAAAVLAAFAIELAAGGVNPEAALVLLALTALICGLLQVAFGAVGLGRLIKYMPYPVVSGYLGGVGLVIIVSQIPRFLGAPKGVPFWDVIAQPSAWGWQSIAIGAATVSVMVAAPKVTKAVPAPILGLAAGVSTYFALATMDPALLEVSGNALVVGPLGNSDSGIFEAIGAHWARLANVDPAGLGVLLMPAVTLAVLLSIDTLKTCVILDALTRSRHNSNRELIGQGCGNLAATLVGGVPGAGQMGATLVNMSSGGRTQWSGLIAGVLSLVAFLALGDLVSWVPIAALAGILIVIGVRMFDRKSLLLLRSRSTILDFAVIVAVIVVAKTVGLIAASGTGIGLAILLFIREQIGGSVVRRVTYGNQIFSKQARLPKEMAVLEKRGDQSAIVELQGSLFFGTANQLYAALEPEIKKRSYVTLDMRRVQSVDVTAARILEQINDALQERGGLLIFSHLPHNVPSGRDVEQYLEQVGLVRSKRRSLVFDELDEALEWVENRIIEEEHLEKPQEKPLDLKDIDLFQGRKEETLADLEALTEKRTLKAGEKIFARGDAGDELFLIRRGSVRIVLPIREKQSHHLATFSRGDFFGEMSFLDRAPRSADALAYTDADLFVLSRERFEAFAKEHKKAALQLFDGLARALAVRLRYTNAELRVLEDS